jgi:hypothetical protein
MKLFLSGQQFTTTRPDPPSVVKLKIFLDGSKKGELFTAIQVADAIGHTTFMVEKCKDRLVDYSASHLGKRYFGNKATIKQLRKEIEKDAKR